MLHWATIIVCTLSFSPTIGHLGVVWVAQYYDFIELFYASLYGAFCVVHYVCFDGTQKGLTVWNLAMKRLYIGGLGHTVSEKDLKDRFGKFGDVSDVEIITRKDENGKNSCL